MTLENIDFYPPHEGTRIIKYFECFLPSDETLDLASCWRIRLQR